jgi:tRNA dimethylallyltransferase
VKALKKLIVVAGPTSSGKSDLAVELALKHNGEVINADSRQIYRGLNIGTGKITQEEMKGVLHHMLDICDITESFSVARYKEMVLPIIEDIFARGKTPILCGGTGQYIDIILYKESLPAIPPNNELRKQLELLTNEELYKIIEKKDPSRAKTIDRHNRLRLIRAVEIIEETGSVPPFTQNTFRYETEFYLMDITKELLEERVHRRLIKRFHLGMIEEMQALIAEGYDIALVASRGIEYKWMAKFLEQEITYDELVAKLKIATWQYAKRQRTWNKKYESFAIKIPVTN